MTAERKIPIVCIVVPGSHSNTWCGRILDPKSEHTFHDTDYAYKIYGKDSTSPALRACDKCIEGIDHFRVKNAGQ